MKAVFIESGKTYVVKEENVRKYYKYVSWEQPILTSNTSSSKMTVSATNEGQGGAWKAFDNATDNHWVTANNILSGDVYAFFAEPIYLNSITITGYRNLYGYTQTVTIYSDKAKTNLIGGAKTFFTSTGSTANVSNTWTFDEPIKITDLTFSCVGGAYWVALSEVSINADIVVDGTPDDYDFYKDVDVYKAVKF